MSTSTGQENIPRRSYTYKPLSQDAQTRVLEIYPSLDPHAPLSSALKPINILTDPLYHALSYAWGPRTLTEELYIDGDDQPLMITPNLRDALQQLRLQVSVCRIWVDAICINQDDDDEKSAQIRFMGLIYRRASSVYIWLGKHERESQLLKEVDQFSRTMMQDAPADTLANARKAVDGLIALPWFGRRWVIQEGVSNSNTVVFCGSAGMQWIRLLKVSLYTAVLICVGAS
jgi:Heterokaryon incompatibility protein (HET)